MGDVADMIIEGILCEWCGEYIGDSVGYPRKCSGCKTEYQEEIRKKNKSKKTTKKSKNKQS